MNLIFTLESINDNAKSIFLAGPSYRDYQSFTWRTRATEILQRLGFEGNVFVPEHRTETPNSEWTYSRQVSWELAHLQKADIIVFWIPRDLETLPGFTTNIEIGEWLNSGKIIVGAPANAPKVEYIQERCSRLQIPWHNTLEDCLTQAIQRLNKHTSSIFFTADTHFGQPRTLELSRRPFATVEEMNWALIKNWNIRITNNDIVYHLGDFGEPEFLKYLNAQIIYILPGNYDTSSVLNQLTQDPRVQCISPNHNLQILNTSVSLVHEPDTASQSQNFYLFGHIHQLQMIKQNGLNVGCDCHNFSPITDQCVMFYKNAIEKHYDHNVFQSCLGA